MTSNRFFIDQSPLSTSSSSVFLYGDEHHHLSRVARINPRDKVWLFDAQGTSYLARVEEINQEKTRLFILKKKEKEKPKANITLDQALIRKKKMEAIIQKATEWGISTFIPVITSRTVVDIKDKIEKRMVRWRRIAREAAKQSRQALLPRILLPMDLGRLIKNRKEEKKFLLSESRGNYLKDILLSSSARNAMPSSVIVLVGPEGEWSEEEEENILSQHYEAVSLGRQVLWP
ncbi:MAG: RsmE family RNA methyltransferase [Candidatus Aminicenantes bacterium]